MPNFTITQKIHPISTRYVVTEAEGGGEICHVRKKKFQLREELVLWADEGETRPYARVKARNVVDFGGIYEVLDEAERPVGALRRQGMQSLARVRWEILDAGGTTLAVVQEDSLALALLRRFVGLPLPVGFSFTAPDGGVVGNHKRRFGLRDVYDLQVDGIDPRLAIAQGIALDVLEQR
ncbi:MAG: hypothetical protein MSC31_08395 [Solirubrobacteraceae bacterium MAG38_C4-C5]|nr:hypothetical protein [Candidatus Siliceabacter maunaloa]